MLQTSYILFNVLTINNQTTPKDVKKGNATITATLPQSQVEKSNLNLLLL